MQAFTNLDEIVTHCGDLVAYLRNQPTPTWHFPELSSAAAHWSEEQVAARAGALLLQQGHLRSPVSELYVEGPGALSLLTRLGTNSFARFVPGTSRHYLVCSPQGFLIGDCMLHYLAPETFCLVGAVTIREWVRFHAAGMEAQVRLSDRRSGDGGAMYQFQILGPRARAIYAALNGGSFPELRLFHSAELHIAGHPVRCLRHSLLGDPGLECWLPLAAKDEVLDAVTQVGKAFGLRQAGTRAYPSLALDAGWIGLPLPAIYSGEDMRSYRRFLSPDSIEAQFSIAGSFQGQSIEDYYYTPFDLGYDALVNFDHDFIGRDALEGMGKQSDHRKVTLEWHPGDVARIHASWSGIDAVPYKAFELPFASYGMVQCDKVSYSGRIVGRSADAGYSHPARATLSLAVIDRAIALGDQVTVTWGEEGGGRVKAGVEHHRQFDVRAMVCPAPYARLPREAYPPGWR